mgnify:FL=1
MLKDKTLNISADSYRQSKLIVTYEGVSIKTYGIVTVVSINNKYLLA